MLDDNAVNHLDTVTFDIFQRIRGAKANKIVGTITIIGGAIWTLFMLSLGTEGVMKYAVLLSFLIVVIGIIMIIRSFSKIYGKLIVDQNEVHYQLGSKRMDFSMAKIVSVTQNGTVVSIKANGSRVAFESSDATQIVSEINLRIKKSGEQPTEKTEFSNADEIVKYKDLLDTGAITQEQYTALVNKLIEK